MLVRPIWTSTTLMRTHIKGEAGEFVFGGGAQSAGGGGGGRPGCSRRGRSSREPTLGQGSRLWRHRRRLSPLRGPLHWGVLFREDHILRHIILGADIVLVG